MPTRTGDDSIAGRAPIRRIAVTVPPKDWFHGIARSLFDRYRQALVELDIALFDVPVDLFLVPDVGRIALLIEELRAFRPECAIGLPLGSYALLCRLPARRDGWRPNLFADVLDVPTVCLWDHAPVELADVLLAPHPADPAASTPGADAELGRVLAHPRLIHWSRDSGQTRIMRELGFVVPDRLVEDVPPLLPGFWRPAEGTDSHDAGAPPVGFVGHLYQEPPSHPHPSLSALADHAIETWIDARERSSLWEVLQRRIRLLPEDERRPLALESDQRYFWPFAHQLICHQAQTAFRLKLLGGAGVRVACYGNLRTDMEGVPGNLIGMASNVPYGPELAALFARHPITIDVLNPGFVAGYSHKQVHAFASGGFLLMNRKQDFVDAFGEAGEAVSCTSAEDVGVKVEQFLTDTRYRREVGDAIREQIRARFQLKDGLARALHQVFACIELMGTKAHSGIAPLASQQQPTMVEDLLPNLRCEPQWSGAHVEHRSHTAIVSTGPTRDSPTAAIPLPSAVSGLREPHVRLRLIVEAGRIWLGVLLRGSRTFVSTQLVSPTAAPVTVELELPRKGARSLLLRNAFDAPSRAVVLEASLCDRPK